MAEEVTEVEGLAPLSDQQMESLEAAVARYEQHAGDPDVLSYLDARGLDYADSVSFRLGRVIDPAPEHHHAVGRMAIPYLDRFGNPLSIKFRCLAEHNCKTHKCPKIISVSGERARLFNAARAILGDPLTNGQQASEIHVTEGEIDCIALVRAGFTCAVGLPGASAWRSHYSRLLGQFKHVWVWGDPDESGQKLNAAITKVLWNARAVPLEHGDVAETLARFGPDALEEALSEARS